MGRFALNIEPVSIASADRVLGYIRNHARAAFYIDEVDLGAIAGAKDQELEFELVEIGDGAGAGFGAGGLSPAPTMRSLDGTGTFQGSAGAIDADGWTTQPTVGIVRRKMYANMKAGLLRQWKPTAENRCEPGTDRALGIRVKGTPTAITVGGTITIYEA